MNVELVNPVLVFGLIRTERRSPAEAQSMAAAWASRVLARLDEKLRYRRAPRKLHQLDDREFDDLALAPADLPALAWAM